jgi:hypothetical protein
MTSFRQLQANRRNALRSTGPRTQQGKQQSRLNAVRHGLTAETVIEDLEDGEDYKEFEATIIADYCAETAVARELVLRLASLLWRLRRVTAIESQLLAMHSTSYAPPVAKRVRSESFLVCAGDHSVSKEGSTSCCRREPGDLTMADADFAQTARRMTHSFLCLANLDSGAFERHRYEAALWRQAVQIIFTLHPIKQR